MTPDPFASQEHDFDDLMREADRLRKQVDAAKARVNSAAAILAEKQLEYDNNKDELHDLKARLDRTRTKLVAIIDEKTDHDHDPDLAPAPALMPARMPASLPPNVSQVLQPASKRAASHLLERTDYNIDDDEEDDDRDDVLRKKMRGPNIRSVEKIHSAIHPSFPTVVFIDGFWTEVRCGICGANAGAYTGAFIKGLTGFKIHMSRAHHSPGSLKLHKRVLNKSEEESLKRGKQPEEKRIKMRYGKEYVPESKGAKLKRFSISDEGQDNDISSSRLELC